MRLSPFSPFSLGNQYLRYGINGPGVSFTASITPPANFTTGGQQWVQLEQFSQETVAESVGESPILTCSTAEGLDTQYPYTANSTMIDSPQEYLVTWAPDDKEVTRSDTFKTYLMWKPNTPNAIFVTLATVSWGWFGDAILNAVGNWVLNPSSPPLYTGPVQATATDFPVWSRNASATSSTTCK